jgi:hypothetical protein
MNEIDEFNEYDEFEEENDFVHFETMQNFADYCKKNILDLPEIADRVGIGIGIIPIYVLTKIEKVGRARYKFTYGHNKFKQIEIIFTVIKNKPEIKEFKYTEGYVGHANEYFCV